MNDINITELYSLDGKIYSHDEMAEILKPYKVGVKTKFHRSLNTVEELRLRAKAQEIGFKNLNLIYHPFPNMTIRLEEKDNPAKNYTMSLSDFGCR
jgi:hypothetical protein